MTDLAVYDFGRAPLTYGAWQRYFVGRAEAQLAWSPPGCPPAEQK